MKQNSRLRPDEGQTQASAEARAQANQQASASESVGEFATPEELLRHDAAQTPVPPEVADRLRASLDAEPATKPASWWRRIIGR